MIGNKCKNNENGLTLLGLIITIIVLLILAGVSIAMLTGENGIINKAKEHEIEAQLAIIEEAANIIYVEKKTLGIKNVDIGVVARQLQDDGYEIKVVFGDGIDYIELVGPDIITIGKPYSIAVNPKQTDGEIEVFYYAVVKEKYFEIKNKENGIEVERTESNSRDWEEPNILSASTPANAGYITINSINQGEKLIFISGENPPGSEELNVTWGKKTAKKQIKVLSKLNYLNEVVLKDYTEIPEDIKEKLAQEDYVIEDKTLTTIEDILLTSPEYMPIDYTSQITAEIKSSSKTNFYAVIDEDGDGTVEHYKIEVKDGKVQAEMTPSNVNNETLKLEAKNQKGLITVGNIDDSTNPITIPITSLNNTGTETITVEYGSVSKNCNIEVLSKLDYLDKLLEKEEEISDKIIDNVKDDGYTIEKITKNKVTDISIVSPGSMSTSSTSQLSVTAQTTNETFYYVLIEEKYYKIVKSNNKVIVEKTESTINDEIFTLTATSNNSYVTIGTISGMNIQIASGNSKGKSTITVSYGGKTKSCEINVKVMPKEGSTADGNVTFSTEYGTIDVIWLDTSNNVISQPNEPVLAGMTPVTWTYDESSSKWIEDSTAKSTWYDYIAVDSRNDDGTTVDNLTSMWANAKNSDGSYFVWIPRYAYRITYFSSTTSTEATGYYDGWGQWRASDGRIRHAIDTGVETVIYNGDKYIVHPAFETYLDLGGWDEDLTGFWFAKYEMSRTGATNSSSGSGETFFSVPNVQVWYYHDIKYLYTFGLNYDKSKQSHLTKNSEWGAVAYLAHSKYGRNGNQIYINNNLSHITGKAGNTASASESSSKTANLYNTISGAKASTTGNIYGIYDMSGCNEESVACWDTKTTSSYIKYGNTFATKGGKSTKYATAYSAGDSPSGLSAQAKYIFGKVGDATKEVFRGGEVATSSNSYSYYYWYGDYYDCVGTYGPFMARGYDYSGTSRSGIFSFESHGGSDVSTGCWRPVLCP